MSLEPGIRLGRYEVLSRLGAGGMGEVFLARDHDLGRDVAIKVLRREAQESSDRVRRFAQEAKAASALNHPNVTHVYEVGTTDAYRFIVMELVRGTTLRKRISEGPLSIDEILSIGSQIAAAVGAAHDAGIVHRDIKPENVMIRPDGYAKVLDFGLAKLSVARGPDAQTEVKTSEGVVVGTLRYMAPEQLGGGEISPSTDVFSLGAVLYEMVSGSGAFNGATPTEIITSILTKAPPLLSSVRPETPPRLAAAIAKAMSKEVGQRHATAGELAAELRDISRENVVSSSARPATTVARRRNLPRAFVFTAAAALVIAMIAGAVLLVRRSQRNRQAEASIVTALQLIERRSYADACLAAGHAAQGLPADPRVIDALSRACVLEKFESDPPGAAVYLQRFAGSPERQLAGTTPFTAQRLPRADYLVTFEKPGFRPAFRPLPLMPVMVGDWEVPAAATTMRVKLDEASQVPDGMVLVHGTRYRLSLWNRPSDRIVDLHDFHIDRTEVSNASFEAFIRDGGYRRPELWKHPFIDGERTLTFDEAMARFRDTTGLPGPRSWSGGAPPAPLRNHPVTDITWYEAEAFAAWQGKRLPTVYEWEKAAEGPIQVGPSSHFPWGLLSEGVDATERANFRGKGTMPVDSMPFGLSVWGVLNLAGNVSEWCLNAYPPGFAVRGGSWNDPVYEFGQTGAVPGFFSSGTIGFRCVRDASRQPADQGGFALSREIIVPVYHPAGDGEFETIRSRYEYAHDPLDARVVERIETSDWRREKITYSAGGKTVTAYLYLPKGFKPPFQVVHFSAAGDVAAGYRTLTASIEQVLAPLTRDGRAVFSVVLEGYVDRPYARGFKVPDSRSDAFVDFTVERVTEIRRGLDYLESRSDVDRSRMAFFGPSAGAAAGVILTGLENRYRSVLFQGTGIGPSEVSDAPAANRINFVPHISGPKLMLQGKYDESAPLETSAKPLFALLREPKRLEVFEGGHVPSEKVRIPMITRWLDETLGAVGR